MVGITPLFNLHAKNKIAVTSSHYEKKSQATTQPIGSE